MSRLRHRLFGLEHGAPTAVLLPGYQMLLGGPPSANMAGGECGEKATKVPGEETPPEAVGTALSGGFQRGNASPARCQAWLATFRRRQGS